MVPVVKNPPANAGDIRDGGSIPESERSPEEETGDRLLPGQSHEQRSLAGYDPWVCKRVRQDLVTKQQQ